MSERPPRGDMTAHEQRIRERAKRLWEQAGQPEGRDDDFWHEAELQIEVEDRDTRPDPPMPPRSRTL